MHIVEAEAIGRIGTDRDGPAARVVEIRLLGREAVARREPRRGAGARGVFPLRVARQPIRVAGLARQPGEVFLRIAPRHVDDGIAPAAHAEVARRGIARAAARGRAFVPVGECHLVAADCKRARHVDLVLKCHGERARRHDHHLGAVGAILEYLARLQAAIGPADFRQRTRALLACRMLLLEHGCFRLRSRRCSRPLIGSPEIEPARERGMLPWHLLFRRDSASRRYVRRSTSPRGNCCSL